MIVRLVLILVIIHCSYCTYCSVIIIVLLSSSLSRDLFFQISVTTILTGELTKSRVWKKRKGQNFAFCYSKRSPVKAFPTINFVD